MYDEKKLFSRFREEEPTDEDFEALGSNKAYHIDLIPKVIVTYGSMAQLLREIGVYDNLELRPIDLHMVYSGRLNKIGRVAIIGVLLMHSSPPLPKTRVGLPC